MIGVSGGGNKVPPGAELRFLAAMMRPTSVFVQRVAELAKFGSVRSGGIGRHELVDFVRAPV